MRYARNKGDAKNTVYYLGSCRYRTKILKRLTQSLKHGPLPDEDFDTTTDRFNAV